MVCTDSPYLCLIFEGFFLSRNAGLDDPDRYAVYMAHYPAGASVQSFVHFG